MGTTYDPKAPILGMEARRFRTLLSAWEKRRDLRALARVASLGTTPAEVAAVVDEAEARGFLGFPPEGAFDHRFGFAEPGLALLNATSRKRIVAAKGWEILRPLLDNATAANARRDLPFAVEAIWLYGSLAKGKPTVDDIDVVIETRTPSHMTMERADAIAWEMCRSMGGGSAITYGGVSGCLQAMEWIRDRMLYGTRRNPRLSVRTDPSELRDMAVPCRKVFDRTGGVNLDAPLLKRHPGSRGRQAYIGPPRVVPDLGAEPPLAPAHCHAAVGLAIAEIGYRPNGYLRLGAICTGDRSFPQHLEGFVASCGMLDGRSRAVLHDWEHQGQAMLVEARLDDGVLHVDTGARSEGSPLDEEALGAYLRAVFACTAHRAGLRGRVITAGFIDGEEVDVRDETRAAGGFGPGR